MNQDFLEKQLILILWQEIYKVNLEHTVMIENQYLKNTDKDMLLRHSIISKSLQEKLKQLKQSIKILDYKPKYKVVSMSPY